MTIKPKYRRGDILNNVTVDETEDDSGNDSDSGDGCDTETNLNSKSEVNPNTDNIGKCNATDAHTGIHIEEGSTSFIRHGVNDKLKDITLAEISSSYVRDTCDSEVKSTNPNCQTTFPYNIVNVDTTHGPINTPSKTKLKAHNNRTSLSRSPKCNNISRRSSSVPVNTSKVKLDGNPRKKRFKSLRLINPIFGVRGWHQSRKSQGKPKKCPIITSQPIPDSSERFCDSVTLSDSFSNIQRCNLRILSEPPMVTGSVSHEVDNTILIGNQIGFNMNGVPEDHKKSWIKRLCSEHKVNFLGIQETMTGGILAVWDTSCFSLIDSLEGNDYREKKKLWKELSQVITFHNTFTILLGDFNEVRSESERMGTIFDPRGAAKFNDFITIADLCDLPMGGKWFTQMNNLGSKLSKIDRVLVSNHVIQRWPNSYVFALPREFCDHTPLLLKNLTVDYGPTPFKLYNSWIDHTGFLSLVQNSWSSAVNGPPLVNIRDKVDGIDNKAESHPLNSEEIDDRIQWVKLLANFEHQKVKDLRQKAKLKWALEGDENSQFFHGIINNRRNRARINGLNIQGDWVTEHLTIKNHILNFFSNRFNEENCSRPQFTSSLFKQLSQDDIKFLDCSFTTLEIKEAVWDCGSSKSLGPDVFTFTFFKKHWDIVEHDVISYVKDFEVSAHIPKGCNSSFITLVPKVEDPLTIGDFRPISLIGCQYKIIAKILARRLSRVVSSVIRDVQMAFIKGRQIIDGPLIVDEIIAWAKKYKNRLMFLKVDFEKAFDSLSWSFLFSILEQIGFSSK
ncbi:RNA-directed DNA polymerase, eukaryota [Tanacetum coccineum]